jgi:peptide/nickel transport system ATP-binding protein
MGISVENDVASKGTPLLSLRDIEVTFTKAHGIFQPKQASKVLRGINLDIYPGEVLALVGESGGGKTTVGNVITALVRPSAGKLLFNGEDVLAMPVKRFREYRTGVQIVQQDSYAALNPSRTIFHSLCDPILKHKKAHNTREARKIISKLLETVELRPVELFLDKYPHQLSGGQRQRVLMVRAISLEPRLIIADEPVSMIDVSLRISILNLMTRLNRELGIAFLYITHDLATARYISRNGRLCVLYLGKIVESGPVRALIETPAHPYLRALLLAVPVPDPEIAAQRRKLQHTSIEMPISISPPSGCCFHTRCPYAQEECSKTACELYEYKGRWTACVRANDIPDFTLV